MKDKFLYISSEDINSLINENYDYILSTVQEALLLTQSETVMQPDKTSLIIDERTQNRINCLPATILDKNISGIKWISVFPSNKKKEIDNVEGFTFLSETETGKLKSILNSTLVTSLRTAAIGAIAAKYLARTNSKVIGFIGAGEEAKAHFKLIKCVLPELDTCYFSSRTKAKIADLINELEKLYPDVKFINSSNDYEEAASNSDIIVTAISSQEKVLKKKWIKEGSLYIHVAGLEDEFDVALSANKIICDSWECVKHRTQTISQMYKQGLLQDIDIYADLVDIINGRKKGRERNDEFIYFNSVGLALIDVYLANSLYELAIGDDKGNWIVK